MVNDRAHSDSDGNEERSMIACGYQLLYANRLKSAIIAFRAACAETPGNGEAWAVLAETEALDRGGQGAKSAWEAVVAAYGRAVRLEPRSWRWRLGWGESRLAAGDSDVVALFAELVGERSDSAVARRGLARAYLTAGRSDDALTELREAHALDPSCVDTLSELARGLIGAGEPLAAVEALQPWLGDADAALQIVAAEAWRALGEPEKARSHAERALAVAPDDPAAQALAEAIAADGPAGVTPAYVRALFDRYADRFDEDLVVRLGYVAPSLLRNAVDRVCGGAGRGMRIMDLGCGSGLAGIAFRPLASRLAGVDLAPRMVDRARARDVYDDLSVGDAVDALVQAPAGALDLIVAADVLVYLGPLETLFAASARALTQGGLFAATVEDLAEGGDYRLGAARRFAHAASYIERCAGASGLSVRLMEPCSPRREKGVPVRGTLFVLARD